MNKKTETDLIQELDELNNSLDEEKICENRGKKNIFLQGKKPKGCGFCLELFEEAEKFSLF